MKFFTEKRVDFMKKALTVIVCILLLTGCTPKIKEKQEQHIGVWISYSEVNSMLDGDFKVDFDAVVKNCQSLGINNIYIHVRAFGDSLYKSSFFPLNPKCEKYDFDILEYVTELCHKNGISVHAWINPYRISSSTQNIEEINPQSPAAVWLLDDDPNNDKNVCFADGIYLNPAESEVRQLILDGVREILDNYDIDGIHYDDYFYPTQSEEFDKISYTEYAAETESPLCLADWRRINVDSLISGTYNAVKYKNSDVVFSVSPAADINKNYENLYADVAVWIDNGYIDAIIPQLYFGFEYPDDDFKFPNLLKDWKDICALNPDVRLNIGLAFYKAKPTLSADIPEWQENDDIIARQIEIINEDNNLSGYVFFSYSSLFSDEEEFKNQRESLKTGD